MGAGVTSLMPTPAQLEIALNAELMIDYECFEPITPGRPPSLWELDDASEKESSTPSMGASSSSLGAMVGASLMPASPPKPMQAELPVPPASLMPAMLVTAGTGHPWRRQQAQVAQQAHQADRFVDGLWSEDAGGPSPIGGVACPRSLSLVGARCRSVSLAASALDDLSPLKTALKEILK
jgi:hypothetical protein